MTGEAIIILVYAAVGLLILGAVAVESLWDRKQKLDPSADALLPELHMARDAIRQGRISAGVARLDEVIEDLESRNVREAA